MDLGKRPSQGGPELASPSKPSNEKYYPSLHIDGKQPIPGAVGSVIHAHVLLKKTSHTIRKDAKHGTEHSHSFDVHGIKPVKVMSKIGDAENEKEMAIEQGMEEGADGSDGGRPNVQSMMAGGLQAARLKNLEKARAEKKK